jgi:hypothetical protein
MMTVGFGATAWANDLPDGHLVNRQVSPVTIYSVDSATVTHQVIDTNRGFTNFSGVVEASLTVEGNLCSGVPEDVSIMTIPTSQVRTNLSLISTFTYDPFSTVAMGCSAYSVVRVAKIAIPVRSFVRNASVFSKIFVVSIDPANSQGQKAEIQVSFSTAGGFKAVIQ